MKQLSVHCPNEQFLSYAEGQEENTLEAVDGGKKKSAFQAYMDYNKENNTDMTYEQVCFLRTFYHLLLSQRKKLISQVAEKCKLIKRPTTWREYQRIPKQVVVLRPVDARNLEKFALREMVKVYTFWSILVFHSSAIESTL